MLTPEQTEILKAILQAVALLIGAIFSAFQLRRVTSRSRSNLKADLEILNLLPPSSPHKETLQQKIDERVHRIYFEHRGSAAFKVHNWSDFIFGVVAILIFSAWTMYLLKDGFSSWAVLTGLGSLIGIGGILNGLEAKKPTKPALENDV